MTGANNSTAAPVHAEAMARADLAAFARDWLQAWNGRDLDAILAHYHEDIEFVSPLAKQVTGSDRVVGKAALRRYWTRGLELNPALHFEFASLLGGEGCATLIYRNHHGQQVAETFDFSPDGRVVRAYACYGERADPSKPVTSDTAASPSDRPLILRAAEIAPRARASIYPFPFAERMRGRIKRVLGDAFGLTNFGVNLTILEPGAISSLLHRHSAQDEFIYVLEGELVLRTGAEEATLRAGTCAGFPALGRPHHLINRFNRNATYLEIGDRSAGDTAVYPEDDLTAVREENTWVFRHKDGRPYD